MPPAAPLVAVIVLAQVPGSPAPGDGRVPPPTATMAVAVRASRAPALDGTEDDAVWREAPAITAFREFSPREDGEDRKSTRLNSSHVKISYAVFCLKKKKNR